MNCYAFRSCLDHMPILDAATRAHHEACADCQAWLEREQAWQQVFANVPEPRARPSVWPGVMAAIASRRAQPASLSWELVALSRYLVPVLTALVLALGGVGLWGQVAVNAAAPETHPAASVFVAEPTTELAFLRQDADTILGQWAGVSQP